MMVSRLLGRTLSFKVKAVFLCKRGQNQSGRDRVR